MLIIPNRVKLLAASGVLVGGLGVASLNGVFAAPLTYTTMTPVATTTGAPSPQATTTPRPVRRPVRKIIRFAGIPYLKATANYLGLKPVKLVTDLRKGQTLAQVAQAQGKSTSELTAFLTNEVKTGLDKAVANNKLTSQQESTRLAKASARIAKLVNIDFPQLRAQRAERQDVRQIRSRLPIIAKTLGMKPKDVLSELEAGKTVSQIAQEHGKTVANVETPITTAFQSRLNTLFTTDFQQALAKKPQATPTAAPTTTPGS